MKKPIAMMAVLSTAAVMAALTPASFTGDRAASALAATSAGWVEENGTYRYIDSDGYYLTNTWKKNDGDMYYLDEDGEVAINTIIDDEYYVDETGKRVSSRWVSVYNEEEMDSPDAPEYFWHYFDREGKAIKSKWFKIDEAWYYFDSDGHMVTGEQEIDGYNYYFGDENDGVRKSGWIQLEDWNNDDPDSSTSWHYYDNNGRRVENQVDRKIDGNYYTFVNGKMQTGWFKLPEEVITSETYEASASDAQAAPVVLTDTNTPTIHGYQYYEEDGKRASGWYEIEGAEGISDEYETYRFYFRSGKPLAAETGIQVFTIDSKKYAFNQKGEMQTGKQVITLEDGTTANAYFGEDGVMRTGKQNIYDEDLGENQTWYFHTDGTKKGQGYDGIRDNVIYFNGLRQQAPSELRYSTVEYDGNTYLVNTSGSIQKASSSSKSAVKPELGNGFKDVKDANDYIWVVDVNGIVQK